MSNEDIKERFDISPEVKDIPGIKSWNKSSTIAKHFYWRKIINVPDQIRLYFGLLAFRNFDSLLVRYCPFLLDYTVPKLFYGKAIIWIEKFN